MTSLAVVRKRLASLVIDPVPGAPDSDLTVAPASAEEAGDVLRAASEHGLPVLVWGGGTHQGYGGRIEPAVLLSTRNLLGIDWHPDDLTATVGPGVTVADLEDHLRMGGQTAVLPERPGAATVGGVVAAGMSGYRRLRYGPTRDRVLGLTMVTGDGRIVHGRGTVVKNVAGYDLPRLVTGSFGRLGLVTEVTLKLWPVPPAVVTVDVEAPERAPFHRPLAVLETDGEGSVILGGHPAALDADAPVHRDGATWPEPISTHARFDIRVPARLIREAIGRIPDGWRYIAQFGVGVVTLGVEDLDIGVLVELRRWAESVGGSLVVAAGAIGFDPWGTPPPSLDIQRRIVTGFDPAGIMGPGRLPGGL
jgi:FAD/FMN-containing dehydrogenase